VVFPEPVSPATITNDYYLVLRDGSGDIFSPLGNRQSIWKSNILNADIANHRVVGIISRGACRTVAGFLHAVALIDQV
jgi:hypothetical protein